MSKIFKRRRLEKQWVSYIFISPKLILLALFFVFPLLFSVYISLTDWSALSTPHFIGLSNYKKLLGDDIFLKSLINAVVYVSVRVPFMVVVSLLLALLINEKLLGRSAFRTIYFIPEASAMVVAAMVWVYLYNTEFGVINFLLRKASLPPQQWLSSSSQALYSIILMTVWKDAGFYMIIFLAGLQGIPKMYYEAATIDGATRWQMFYHITLPLLKPVVFLVVVMCTIWSFQFFPSVYVMTGGGPVYSTMSLVLYVYNQGFKYFKMGYAAAIAYVLFFIILSFSIIERKYLGQEELY